MLRPLQRDWRGGGGGGGDSGIGESGGGVAQRKMLRLALPARRWGWEGGAGSALNLRAASLSRVGEVQVPGRAVFTCASSGPSEN